MQPIILTVVQGGLAGQTFTFDGDLVRLGRKSDNDLQLAAGDGLVSGHHCELRRQGDKWILHDLGSTNGTLVNKHRVSGPVVVQPGTRIEMGEGGPLLVVAGGDQDQDMATIVAMGAVSSPSLGNPQGMAAVGNPATFESQAPKIGESQRINLRAPGAQTPKPMAQPPITGEGVASTGRTAYYKAMMQDTVKRSSLRLKIAIAVLATLLVGGGVFAAFYISGQADQLEEQKDTTEKLQAQADEEREKREQLEEKLTAAEATLGSARENLAATANRLSTLKIELQKAEGEAKAKLEAQAKKLEETRVEYEQQLKAQEAQLAELRESGRAAERIAAQFEKSLFMLIAVSKKQNKLIGFCTAFALNDSGLLGTNAHCAAAIQELDGYGLPIVARMNRDPDKTYQVVKWRGHGGYKDKGFSADVALLWLELEGAKLPVWTKLASVEKVRALKSGQPIYTMGFPGKVMNESTPAADFRAAVISRLTTFENTPGDARTARMVWHSALTSKGTSGSPIFDAEGEVIAVNTGGLGARKTYMRDAESGELREEITYDATGLNYGIRIDALREMLK